MFQSTRPRGARPAEQGLQAADVEVSIHAPAWGATYLKDEAAQLWRVSIHAPAWGATADLQEQLGTLYVSIHAPAWGATQR